MQYCLSDSMGFAVLDVEVVGSNPAVPTNSFNKLERPQRSAIAPDRSNWSVNARFYLQLARPNYFELPVRIPRFVREE